MAGIGENQSGRPSHINWSPASFDRRVCRRSFPQAIILDSTATDESFRWQDASVAWPFRQLRQEAVPRRVARPAPGVSPDPNRCARRRRDRPRRNPSPLHAATPRIFKFFDDMVDHCCYAWNRLIGQPWKIMSIARRDWVAGRQGREAHHPVLPNREAAPPRTLSGDRGEVEKIQDRRAHGGGAIEFC
jgi:hypothetical protein